jgi:uncharacterized membrane protein
MDWVTKILQASGPYSTPAAVLMGVVIKYLLTALSLMEARAVKAEQDAITLRERRAEELVKATTAMGEFGEQMRNRIREHDENIERVLDLVQRR